MERNCKWECLSMIKEPEDNTITFKMDNFSKLDKKYYESSVHTIGDSKWYLLIEFGHFIFVLLPKLNRKLLITDSCCRLCLLAL